MIKLDTTAAVFGNLGIAIADQLFPVSLTQHLSIFLILSISHPGSLSFPPEFVSLPDSSFTTEEASAIQGLVQQPQITKLFTIISPKSHRYGN